MKPLDLIRNRRRSRSSPAVSLFPFLAVLICTMGALVLLLFAVTRQAKLQAVREAAIEAAKQQGNVQADRELVQWRVAKLKESRQTTEKQMADARLELGHLEDHSRRLREQLAQLASAYEKLEQTEGEEMHWQGVRAGELERLQGEIAEAQRRLAAQRQAVQERPRSYAIIPYEGPNQTRRRPIYVECRSDAVVLQPEGIVLTEADFNIPEDPGNPLAAALRAAREHLLSQGGFDPNSGEPYPLMLVRPSGIAAYYVARAALKSWSSDFGYELIEEDWSLRFPPADPRLAQVLRQTVAEARGRQDRLIAAAPSRLGGRAMAPRRTTGSGGMGSGEMGSGGTGTGGTGSGGVGGSAMGGGGTGTGGRGASGTGAGGMVGSGMGSGGVAGGRGSSGNVLRDGTSDGGPGLRSADTAGRIASLYGAGQGTPGAGPTATGEWSPGPSGGTTGASSPGGSASARGTVRPEGFVAGRPGEDAPPPRNASPGSSGVFSAPLRPGEYQPTEPYRPAKRDDDPEEKRAKYKRRLAEKRGQDWGLRDATRGAFPITRPIRVECYADRLVLAAGRGTGPSQIVPLAGRTEASLDKLMTAVWERMDSWGMAGQGMYWRPVLQVQVAPDAEERFAELHKLLDGSGINVERK